MISISFHIPLRNIINICLISSISYTAHSWVHHHQFNSYYYHDHAFKTTRLDCSFCNYSYDHPNFNGYAGTTSGSIPSYSSSHNSRQKSNICFFKTTASRIKSTTLDNSSSQGIPLFISSDSNHQNDPAIPPIDNNTASNIITSQDCEYMLKALECAKKGLGNTYPNPAVGCILVDTDTNEIIGSGFHPKAGYPHAEIFALLEGANLVPSGVESALSVVDHTSYSSSSSSSINRRHDSNTILQKVNSFTEIYKSTNGAKELFENIFENRNVVAYVTLEPCCHYGQTPPCAVSLLTAGVKRVVVGFRDPNPRVDGGGVLLLQNEGIRVDLMKLSPTHGEEGRRVKDDESLDQTIQLVASECAHIVKSFVKRITPREISEGGVDLMDYDVSMNGAKRSALRNIAGRWKNEGTMVEFLIPAISSSSKSLTEEEMLKNHVLNHQFLESIDNALWEKEMVLLRLNSIVSKKKEAKVIGEHIAKALSAHVAQVVGHTVLLYRPGFPVVLNLDEIVKELNN